jgi:ABC-type multidrug transport system fused ATPase/permease subunit
MRPYSRYLLDSVLRHKKKLYLLSLLIVADTLLRLAQPYIYKLLVDTLTEGLVGGVFTSEAAEFLIILVIGWFIISVLNNFAHAQSTYYGWMISNDCSEIVHMDGYRRLLRLDYQEHTKRSSTKNTKVVDDAESSTWELVSWFLNRIFPSMLGFFGMLILAFSVSWQMTLLSLTVIPFGLALVIFMIRKYENEQHRINKLWMKMIEHMHDQISNVITYKLNQNEKLFMDVQKKYASRAYTAQKVMSKKWRLTTLLNPDVLARFMVMGFGIFLVQDGSITLGTLFMFMGLLNEILSPLHLLTDILPQFSRRARHIDRYVKLMKQQDFVKDPINGTNIKNIVGKVEFKNVGYSYSKEADNGFSLKNISFVIEPGEEVAIVGHSGAGKTTVVSLLTRLADVTAGKILVDGIDIRNIKQQDYRKFLGVVLQENAIYNETILQNIAYGKPGASREEIIEAAKLAQAHEFIMRLPKKYDTKVGEKGVRLSGGEKQRIAISRAILKQPRIVILDEPTSALDAITEAKVQKGLIALMEGRTAIVIAHRLSTVRNADKIIIFDKGRISDIGSHRELLSRNKAYHEMVELQTGGFLAQ